MKLKITKIAARTCAPYNDQQNCLACTAAKRQFKTKRVFAGATNIEINGKWYTMTLADGDKVFKSYNLILGAASDTERFKIRPDFKPFTVELTPL